MTESLSSINATLKQIESRISNIEHLLQRTIDGFNRESIGGMLQQCYNWHNTAGQTLYLCLIRSDYEEDMLLTDSTEQVFRFICSFRAYYKGLKDDMMDTMDADGIIYENVLSILSGADKFRYDTDYSYTMSELLSDNIQTETHKTDKFITFTSDEVPAFNMVKSKTRGEISLDQYITQNNI